MASIRKEEALSIIEKALKDVHDDAVSVSSLLMKCQSVMRLLNLEEDVDWITYELSGYPFVPNIASQAYVYRISDLGRLPGSLFRGLSQEDTVWPTLALM